MDKFTVFASIVLVLFVFKHFLIIYKYEEGVRIDIVLENFHRKIRNGEIENNRIREQV